MKIDLPWYCTQPEEKFHNFIRLKRRDENFIRIFFIFIRELHEDLIRHKKKINKKKITTFCHTHFIFPRQLIHKRERRNLGIYFFEWEWE